MTVTRHDPEYDQRRTLRGLRMLRIHLRDAVAAAEPFPERARVLRGELRDVESEISREERRVAR